MTLQFPEIHTEIDAQLYVSEIHARHLNELETSTVLRGSISANLSQFSGPQSAPYELLQNADDAFRAIQSTPDSPSVVFKSTQDYLLVANNGAQFTAEDVYHISVIGQPHKEAGIQSGWMDFGFKSVFQVTDNPQVFSGPFRFAFQLDRGRYDVGGCITPDWVEDIPEPVLELYQSGWTVFYLPFRDDLPDLPKFYRENINFTPLQLAFLRNLRNVTIQTEDGQQDFEVSSETSGRVSVTEHTVSSDPAVDPISKSHSFRIFQKKVFIPEKARTSGFVIDARRHTISEVEVSLAFYLDDEENIAIRPGTLSYFIPTVIQTGLPFDVNADFILNPTRTAVRQDLEWNKILWAGLVDLFVESIKDWRKHPQWKYQFYSLIPNPEKCITPIDRELADPIVEYCKNSDIILSSRTAVFKPEQVLIANEQIHKVIDFKLWNGNGFLHPKISSSDAISAVVRLGASDRRGTEGNLLIEYIDQFGTSGIPTKFFRHFYDYLSKVVFDEKDGETFPNSAWMQVELRKREIVIGSPRGRFLPQQTTYPTSSKMRVRKSLMSGLKFVREEFATRKYKQVLVRHLGVSEFTEGEVVRRLSNEPNKGKWSLRKKRDAFEFIHRWLINNNWEVEPRLAESLKNVPVQTGSGWVAGKVCYFHSELNEALCPNSPFIDTTKLSEDYIATYKCLGVQEFPSISSIRGPLPRVTPRINPAGERVAAHHGSYSSLTAWNKRTFLNDQDWIDYCLWLEGQADMTVNNQRIGGRDLEIRNVHYSPWLDELNKLSDELTTDLLGMLIRNWIGYYSGFVSSDYHYYYRTDRFRDVPSFFIYQLKRQFSWLPTTLGRSLPDRSIFFPSQDNRKVIGDIFPFVQCDENLSSNQGARALFQALGLSLHLDRDSILAGLDFMSKRNYLSGIDTWFTDNRQRSLGRVYRELVNVVSADDRLNTPVEIIDEHWEFVAANQLYWDSDQDLRELFTDSHPIAWIPAMETRFQDRFVDFFGINRISDVIASDVIEGTPHFEGQAYWRNRLNSKKDYLYSVFSDALSPIPESLMDFLANPIRVQVCSELQVSRTLKGTTKFTRENSYFDLKNATLWLDGDLADDSDVAYALAQGFNLHSIVEKIELILALGNSQLLARLKKWKVQLLSIDSGDEEMEPGADSAEITTDENEATDVGEDSQSNFENGDVDDAGEAEEPPYDWTSSPNPPPGTPGGGGRRSGGTGGKSRPKTLITGKDMIGAPDPETRKKVEKIGMAAAEWIERNRFGREVEDVSGWESYDLKSWNPADEAGSIRYIEVKASFSGFTPQLTDPEHDFALEKGDQYWLYVVTSDEEDSEYQVFRIQNPANSGSLTLNEHYSPVWRIYGYREATRPIPVPSDELDVQL